MEKHYKWQTSSVKMAAPRATHNTEYLGSAIESKTNSKMVCNISITKAAAQVGLKVLKQHMFSYSSST